MSFLTRMSRAVVAACALGVGIAGCAAPSGSVKHAGRPAGAVKMPLSGVYRATIIPPFDFIGPISGRISAEPQPDGSFIASTRPGVAWDMIGGVQGFLGSIFAPFVFPGGTIATWKSSVPGDGFPGEGWFGVGGIKNAGVRTKITSANEPVELLVREGRRVGLMLLEPDDPDAPPATDYPALAEAMASTMQRYVYDPALARSISIRSYLGQIRYNAQLAHDDVEFLFGTVAAARNHVKFTLPLAFPKGDAASRRAMTTWDLAEITPLRATFDRRTRIAWLRVDAFISARDVDAAFEKILAWKPAGIMIDLRTTPGVTLASLRTLSWVTSTPVDAGVWFGRSRRADFMKGDAPAPRLYLSSAAGVEEIESILDINGAARITVTPEREAYTGPVAVLTSKRTSASAEPLAWALKNSTRARVYGQETAGRPYLSRPFDLGQHWVYWLAACDYRTPAGEAIPDSGVQPHVETTGRESPVRAAEKWLLSEAGEEPVASASFEPQPDTIFNSFNEALSVD